MHDLIETVQGSRTELISPPKASQANVDRVRELEGMMTSEEYWRSPGLQQEYRSLLALGLPDETSGIDVAGAGGIPPRPGGSSNSAFGPAVVTEIPASSDD
jgi:hypothetical protein